MARHARVCITILAAALTAACASPVKQRPEPAFTLTDADYQSAFAAARDVLRDAGFALDRVDADRGVITTLPRASSGFATPWIDHTTSLGDAAAATLHRERRIAEVRFQRDTDSADTDPPIRAHIEVTVQRLGNPGNKPDPTSIRLRSRWTEGPRSANTPATPYDTIVERPDPKLAARLAAQIQDRTLRAGTTSP